MRAVISLMLLLLATLCLSALLAYPIFTWLGEQNSIPFHKCMSRTLVLSGLILSILLLASRGLLNKNALGFASHGGSALQHIRQGMLLGALIVIALEVLLFLLDIHVLDQQTEITLTNILTMLAKSVLAGLVVALIEETIFRGAIFSLLESELGKIMTVMISSLFYAGVHFIKIPEYAGDGPAWFSGFTLLPDSFDFLMETRMLDMMLTLFLLGALLSIFRIRYNNIYYCIGIHAGIVMLIKFSNYLSDYQAGSQFDGLVNYVDHQMGFLASALLLVTVVFIYLKNKKYLRT